jgi:glutaredoxin 3
MAADTVVMYSTPYCPYCLAARFLLKKKAVDYQDINVSADMDLRAEMEQRSGGYTVPQIFIGDTHVGGYDDLNTLEAAGNLDNLLADAQSVQET